MTISYPLTPPATPGFKGIRLRHTDVVGESRSPFSLQGQFYRHAGQILQGEFSLPTLERAEAEAWIAFLLSLKGKSGTFLMGIAGCETPRGALGGSPVINGAGQTGESLAIDGASISVANWARAGDWFQLGSGASTRLHKNLTDVASDGSGELTLDIWPRLRESPVDGAAVTFSNPKGLWRLATNEVSYDLSAPVLFNLSFPVIEAL